MTVNKNMKKNIWKHPVTYKVITTNRNLKQQHVLLTQQLSELIRIKLCSCPSTHLNFLVKAGIQSYSVFFIQIIQGNR